MQNLPVNYDNPQRIRRIVRQATLLDKVVSSNSVMKRTSSVFAKGSRLTKTNPSLIPSRVKNKVQRRFKISNDFSIFGERFLNAEKVAIKPLKSETSTLKVVHVGIHENTDNGGDTLLFPAIRWLWQKHLAPTSFTLSSLREKVTQATIDEINRHDALIIGGGGLFLADTNPNDLSGWQWACSTELLDKIKVPIVLFAVGYNRFRGQKEFKPVFTENLCKLIEKSTFVGLRNYGSIEAIKHYLPESLHHKLAFQPCTTTLLNRFYPDIPSKIESDKPVVSVNIAFDRHHLRFGHREDEILWGIADSLLSLQEQGWQPVLFNHCPCDRDAHLWFKARGLNIEEINLFRVSPQTIINQYSRVSLAIGMRGHAQMIPFGLNCPILSLISHDKLRFFLDDIGHNEWGLELKEGDIKNNLTAKIDYLVEDRERINLQVRQAQDKLWEITRKNLEAIEKSL